MSPGPDLRLVYLRHGETDLNREHRMQGDTDAPLNETGRAQVAAAAKRLRGEKIAAVYSSDLLRARESAEAAVADHDLTVRTDPRLREQRLGDWEGDIWHELTEAYGADAIERFLGDLEFAPPGGESRREVRDRVREFLEDLLESHGDGETVLVVSHGGPLFVLLHEVLDLPYSRRKRFYGANGSVSVFLHGSGGWQLVSFNETWFQGIAADATLD
jgi:broad specificity phosphatase PhoE